VQHEARLAGLVLHTGAFHAPDKEGRT